jgi:group II intron reverse transcriptase/maturase
MDLEWLQEAFRRTRKDGAPGVDGETGREYEANLNERLKDLLERAKSGRYQAPPVRRGQIPKENGEVRLIGIPTFEDKVLQRAVVMILEPIYEHDFMPFSYGFRPKSGAHKALEPLRENIQAMGGCWIIDADISKFFDTVDRSLLQQILRKRMSDGVLGRLIGKWLQAGVMNEGELSYDEVGTPQGGVISPLLSNIYLHEVLDAWFVNDVLPRLQGKAFIIRYADDFVMGFQSKVDADKVMGILPKRFARFGLKIHPEKTRLIDFRRPGPEATRKQTFDFLGFTHYWGQSRKGFRVVKRKTASKRLTRALKAIQEYCKENRHLPVLNQWQDLNEKLRGHYGYYWIRCNYPSLAQFLRETERRWFKWLGRRSRQRDFTWKKFKSRVLRHYPLAKPKAPRRARDTQAKLPFEEPYAGNPLVRVCGGPGW